MALYHSKTLRHRIKYYIFRLSKLSSEKLTINNPSIADLSDPLRPTKLVEMMSELYDDEWTDAFTALKALGKDDKKSVKILLDTFLVCIHDTRYSLSVDCMRNKSYNFTLYKRI